MLPYPAHDLAEHLHGNFSPLIALRVGDVRDVPNTEARLDFGSLLGMAMLPRIIAAQRWKPLIPLGKRPAMGTDLAAVGPSLSEHPP